MPLDYISIPVHSFLQCIKIRIAIRTAMNAIVPRIAMAIQTFISHILQKKHIQGILMFGVQNGHDYKYQDHSQK